MRLGYAGPGGAPVLGNLVTIGVLAVAAFALSQGLTRASFTYTVGVLAAFTLFGLVFLRNDWGIYVVTFSMLLSPEFAASGGGLSEGRSIVVRSEDFVLLVIGFAWLAKTAVNNEPRLVGKPNPFGGYLLLLMAIAGGIALETRRLRLRVACLALVALMGLPFTFTLSRASYVGLPPVLLVLAWFSRQRRFMVGLVLLLAFCSPILLFTLPTSVTKRVLYTF